MHTHMQIGQRRIYIHTGVYTCDRCMYTYTHTQALLTICYFSKTSKSISYQMLTLVICRTPKWPRRKICMCVSVNVCISQLYLLKVPLNNDILLISIPKAQILVSIYHSPLEKNQNDTRSGAKKVQDESGIKLCQKVRKY